MGGDEEKKAEEKSNKERILAAPLSFSEVSLTREQLEEALKKLKETKSEHVTVVVSDAKLLNVDTSGGFVIRPSVVQCMYGRQEDPEQVSKALSKPLTKKRSQ